MYLLALGVVLLLTKYLDMWPGVTMQWWMVLAPFAGAAIWWTIADYTGYTKRQAMKRDIARTQARIDKNRRNIGTLGSGKRRK